MSPAAPEPDVHPNGFADVRELGQFKQFIYDNYHETHGIFGNETEDAWQRRLQGHVPVMRALAARRQRNTDLGLRLWRRDAAGGGAGTWLQRPDRVDISGPLLQDATRRTSAKLRHADGLELLKSSPSGAFGAIIAFDILEHLTRPELLEACREIARTLKPGGRLIIRVPNGGSAYSGPLYWSDLTHERWAAFVQLLKPLEFGHIEAVEIPPVRVHGLESGL